MAIAAANPTIMTTQGIRIPGKWVPPAQVVPVDVRHVTANGVFESEWVVVANGVIALPLSVLQQIARLAKPGGACVSP